jgi:hypothetical protein
MKELLGLTAFRAVGYSLSLDKGTLRYRELVLVDPKEKSAVLNLFPTEPARKELLHFTPADTVLAGAMSNSKGAERWTEMVKLADGFAKMSGQTTMPSEEIAKAEKALGLDIGKDVFGKINDIGFALGDPLKAPIKRTEEKGENFRRVSMYPECPGIVALQAVDEDAATALMEKVLPKLVGAITHKEDLKADSKKVAGQTIHFLPIHDSMGLQYGRSGKTIVIGAFATPVAQALNNGAKEKGWLSEEKVAAHAKQFEGAVFVMAMKPMTVMISSLMPLAHGRAESRPVPAPAPREERQAAPARAEEQMKMPKEIAKLLEKEELLVVRVTHKEGRILEEITWPGLKAVVSGAMDMMLHWGAASGPVVPKDAPTPDRRERQDRK